LPYSELLRELTPVTDVFILGLSSR